MPIFNNKKDMMMSVKTKSTVGLQMVSHEIIFITYAPSLVVYYMIIFMKHIHNFRTNFLCFVHFGNSPTFVDVAPVGKWQTGSSGVHENVHRPKSGCTKSIQAPSPDSSHRSYVSFFFLRH